MSEEQVNFINRELSWLAFNDRVLEEARDKNNPLLERIKFLAITASNLDEFFMVRVASLKKMVSVGFTDRDAASLTPKEQLAEIAEVTHKMVDKSYRTWNRTLVKRLQEKQIRLLKMDQLSSRAQTFVHHFFEQEVYPVVTPMAVDSSRPFPLIVNTSINIAAFIHKEGNPKKKEFATIQVPTIFKRVVKLPSLEGEHDFILLEEILIHYLNRFFVGYEIKEAACYRVMRNMDMDVAEKDTSDLLKEIEEQLKKRERSNVIRLEVDANISKHLNKRLVKALKVSEEDIYPIKGPIDLTFLTKMASAVNDETLLYEPFKPYVEADLMQDLFAKIKEKDYFFHHPYDSFDPVIEFIRRASTDEAVLAIKMTLYRVSGDSPIIKYLGEAAENGKQVTVLVEVKARFDEENNIHWAQELEKAGCHVIYGLVGLKTHCKLTLVVRREEDGIRRYMHMGTGNYNDITAKFYTDMGILTANAEMGIDATNIFNMLSGYSEPPFFYELVIAPLWLRDTLLDLIEREIKAVRQGKPGFIHMKMNSLSDSEMIEALYAASAAGVKIKLIVRGICCLKPGVHGLSENIEVHSVVGRFLEHSRIYHFGAAGDDLLYLSSADLMHRNLNRRVELMFPIRDSAIREQIKLEFMEMFHDNVKTRKLLADGTYQSVDKRGKPAFNVQELFIDYSAKKAVEKRAAKKRKVRTFKPIMGPKNEEE
jgi:polyphosphate kinase